MSKRSFYEQVAFSKELNPFHSLFSLDGIKDLLQKLSIEDTEFGNNLDYLCYMISSNDLYKKFCTWLKNYANNKDLSYYYLGIISLVNRDAILLSRIHKQCIAKDAVIDPIKELKHEIQTSNGNTIHISDLFDINIDILNFVFSLLRFAEFKVKKIPVVFPNEKETELYNFYQISNRFTVLKNLFEQICFEDNRITKKDNCYYISSKNNKFLLKNISRIRIEQLCMFQANAYLDFKKLHNIPNQFKDKPEIVNIEQKNGFLKLKLKPRGENLDLVDQANSLFFYIDLFYPFLPKKHEDLIKRILYVLVFFQQIANKAIDIVPIEKERVCYDNYQFKIQVKEIVQPLSKILGLPINEIINILRDFFENDGTKSFWERPLFRFENNYYLIINSILGCNIFNIFDTWIEKFSDFDKGTLFEDYVKQAIIESCSKKGYFSNVCQTKNYKTEKGKQEIDLVWETKNCIVIGECKCIRYPFDSRDIYNSTKIINKAVEQVKIKSQFLEDNKKSFTKLDLQKKIVRVVITNYPLYTGIIIDGVPVIDFRVLESYIQLGYNGQGISQSGNMRELNKTYFYKNEDEFSENIEKYLIKPDAVETLKQYLTTSCRNMDIFPNLKLILEDLCGTGKEINLPKE